MRSFLMFRRAAVQLMAASMNRSGSAFDMSITSIVPPSASCNPRKWPRMLMEAASQLVLAIILPLASWSRMPYWKPEEEYEPMTAGAEKKNRLPSFHSSTGGAG